MTEHVSVSRKMSKNKFPLPVYKTPIAERKIIELRNGQLKNGVKKQHVSIWLIWKKL